MSRPFNVRVYGILINQNNEVLLSDENRFDRQFTKFPGGGLEFGEGKKECLKREFLEELGIEIEVKELFYLTDYFQVSAFDKKEQLISIYYLVKAENLNSIQTSSKSLDFTNGAQEVHRWKSLETLTPKDLTFPIDKLVAEKLALT